MKPAPLTYIALNPRRISRLLGVLTSFLGGTMLAPLLIGLVYGDQKSMIAFGLSMLITVLTGAVFMYYGRGTRGTDISRRDAIVVVGLSWIFIGMFGGLPYMLDGTFVHFHDAYFETISGFTTTGATVLTDIEGSLSKAGHFWRCLSHWLGGMGIIVLFVAIFPTLGVGGKFLFKSEVPGPIVEGLKPKIKETSKSLWYIYLGLTLANFGLLLAFGGPDMDWFDAICHAFATLATGGFSTKNASIGYYNDYVAVDIITTVFMFLAGINFTLYYVSLMQRNVKGAIRDRELWTYSGITLAAILFATVWLWLSGSEGLNDYSNPLQALRYAAFQVVAVITTTGFGTDNFGLWSPVLQMMLFFLMFMGGSADSTAGGIKVFRVLVVVKACFNEIYRAFRPESVRALRIGRSIVKPEVVHTIVVFFALFLLLYVVATLFVAAFGYDLVTAGSATVACLASIGPGLGMVDQASNFAFFEPPVKIMLSFCMILGRLELFTVLVLLVPSFWRR